MARPYLATLFDAQRSLIRYVASRTEARGRRPEVSSVAARQHASCVLPRSRLGHHMAVKDTRPDYKRSLSRSTSEDTLDPGHFQHCLGSIGQCRTPSALRKAALQEDAFVGTRYTLSAFRAARELRRYSTTARVSFPAPINPGVGLPYESADARQLSSFHSSPSWPHRIPLALSRRHQDHLQTSQALHRVRLRREPKSTCH